MAGKAAVDDIGGRPAPPGLPGRSATRAGGLAFMLALAVAGGGNFCFHVVVSRLLGPASYGVFGSLLVFITLLTVPASGLQSLVTTRTARLAESGRQADGRVLLGRALALGALGTGLLALASPLLMRALRLDSIWPALLLSLYCLPLAATVVPWGLLCGRRRFGVVGVVAVGSTVVRLGVAVLFIEAGFGVCGAVAASVAADSVQAFALYRASRRPRSDTSAAVSLRLGAGTAATGVLAYSGLWLLTGVDTIAARQLLDPVVAGRYSAAATALHGALYGPHAISMALLPAFAALDTARSRRLLIRALLAAAAILGPAMTALTVLSPWLVPLVFGRTFQVPVPVMAVMAVGTFGIGLLWVVVQYNIARSRFGAGAAWLGLPVAAAGAAIWHGSPLALAVVMLPAAVLPLAAATWAALRDIPPAVARAGAGAPMATDEGVDLTVVVPYYNPGPALRANLLHLRDELRGCGISYEIIAVDDGSSDGSGSRIGSLGPTVRCLALPVHQGKGAALRRGLLAGRGRYLGFIGADGDLDPRLWRSFVRLVELYAPDGVVGDKSHPLTTVDADASWTRNMCSAGYRLLIQVLFPSLPVRDTQVGLKVFRRELIADILPYCVEQRFVLDVEILALASRLGYRRILAAPISLYRVDRTTVTPGAVVRMLGDTVRLAWRLRMPTRYPRPSGASAVNRADGPLRPALSEVR
ncbi:glycosyltransferase [Dactylosporangium vinaceum]|uniref:Glycosyltransferase n=1 Tax=Dactylosporangium vinaceum TaxID=53362 RepID=A0ABV5MKS5_9ACTN|nr:glycosyltransferase [Dactylosporangium vinaceum]UAB93913.1 glycosyltransferase [Dactylosporangium vinaceum]